MLVAFRGFHFNFSSRKLFTGQHADYFNVFLIAVGSRPPTLQYEKKDEKEISMQSKLSKCHMNWHKSKQYPGRKKLQMYQRNHAEGYSSW